MKSIHSIRLAHTRKLAKTFETNHAFAEFIDRPSDLISRYIGTNPSKNIGGSMARHIESCFKLPLYYLDNEISPEALDGAEGLREEAALFRATNNLLKEDQMKLLRLLSESLLTDRLSKDDIILLRQLIRRLAL